MGNELAGGEQVIELLVELVQSLLQLAELYPARGWRKVVGQHYRFRLYSQPAVDRQHIHLVYPVAERVTVRERRRSRRRRQTERQAALTVVVHRSQPHLVVTLRHRSVVNKLGNVQQVISIHAAAP